MRQICPRASACAPRASAWPRSIPRLPGNRNTAPRVTIGVKRVALLLALVACSPPRPRIEWGVRQQDGLLYREGTCFTTQRVRVVDDQQRPVAGAEVFVRQRMHLSAPSTVHTTTTFETRPAITDANGVALTCLPDRVPPRSEHEMFVSYRGEIVAKLGKRSGTLASPFTEPLVLGASQPP